MPISGFGNLKIQALNPENLLRAPCKFQYSALNLEIGSKSEPKIYKIQCLNLEIARDEILPSSRKARILDLRS